MASPAAFLFKGKESKDSISDQKYFAIFMVKIISKNFFTRELKPQHRPADMNE